jgi:hypothetical protein
VRADSVTVPLLIMCVLILGRHTRSGALVLGAVVVGSVERKAKKWLKRVRGDKG